MCAKCFKSESVTVNCCLRGSSSHLAFISLVHIDTVLAWLRFRKVYVLKASLRKHFLQVTDINFLSTIS